MKLITTALALALPILWLSLAESVCPPPYSIQPCYCNDDKSVIVCENVTYEEDLKSVMIAAKKKQIAGVHLQSISLRYIPEKVFEGTGIEYLGITNSSLLSLSENEQAFRGIEDNLKSLKVDHCPYASIWDWSHLKGLHKLQVLEITNSDLMELREEFLQISHLPLTEINFHENNIGWMPYRAFASFKDLTRIALDGNALTSIMRSTLPRPAKKLYSIGLSHNKIPNIPVNLFSEMPSLKYLYLGGNPMHILDAQTFEPIWKQLDMFVFHDAPLKCDCRLTWIAKMKHKHRFIHGRCHSPHALKGTRISQLTPDDFQCSYTEQGNNEIQEKQLNSLESESNFFEDDGLLGALHAILKEYQL